MNSTLKKIGIFIVAALVTVLLFVNYVDTESWYQARFGSQAWNYSMATEGAPTPTDSTQTELHLTSTDPTSAEPTPTTPGASEPTQTAPAATDSARTEPPATEPQYKLTLTYMGRLGNLMFQTASAYGMAVHNNRQFALPGNFTDTNTLTSIFEGLQQVPVLHNSQNLPNVGFGLWGIFQPHAFDIKLKSDVKVQGYMQSFKYFHDYQSDIRRLFTFARNLTEKAQRLIANLTSEHHRNKTKIGVHVRRGDYTWADKIQYGYILPSGEYFRKAMEYFRNKYGQVVFVVISEELDWCHENINGTDVVYGSTRSAEGDLCVLTLFDHLILSVGTYSWWAGYLNRGEKVYFRNIARNGSDYARDYKAEDFFPEEWIPL